MNKQATGTLVPTRCNARTVRVQCAFDDPVGQGYPDSEGLVSRSTGVMSILTSSIEELVTPQLVGRLAEQTGAPTARVRSVVTSAVATILDGLVTRANDPAAMGRLADLVHGPETGVPRITGAGEPPPGLIDDEAIRRSGDQLLGLAGSDPDGLAARLARYLGIGAKAAADVVGAAAAVVVGGFRKLGRARGGLDATSLASMLVADSREIHAAVPTTMLDGDTLRMAAATEPVALDNEYRPRRHAESYVHRAERGVHRADAAVRPAADESHASRWAWPAIVAVAALAAIWVFGRARPHAVARVPSEIENQLPSLKMLPHDDNEPAAADTEQEPTSPAPEHPGAMSEPPATSEQAVPPAQPTPPTRSATPDQATTPDLGVPAGSPAATLLDELRGTRAGDAGTWIELVWFDTASATLDNAAAEQLADVAKVLAAYPPTHVRIGGYTDPAGPRTVNQPLSQARADAVRKALIADGIDGARIEARGYADTSPVDPGADVEANRRAAIQVIGH